MVWSNDIKPVSPSEAGMPLAEHFRGRGLCVWRTGWDKDDVMLSIESGQYYPVTHNQADKGHFAIYGFGYRWACDPAYGCNRDPQGRCQTVAHSCILIDGHGQSLSGAGVGNNGKILNYDNNEIYGYAFADNTEAYQQNIIFSEKKRIFHYGGEPAHHMDLDHAYRHIFFIRPTDKNPAYVVIFDDIAKDKTEHDYCWQMLSWPDLGIDLTDSGRVTISPKKATANETAKMFVYLDSDSSVTLKQEDYTVEPDDNRKPRTYTRLRAYSKAVNPYFAAVLVPTDGSVSAPKVKFEKSKNENTIQIEWPQKTDTIIWNKQDSKAKPQVLVADK
jgi:hypothetical protein